MGVIKMLRRQKKYCRRQRQAIVLRQIFGQKNGNFKLKTSLNALNSILCKTKKQIHQPEEHIKKLSQREAQRGKEMEDLKETLREIEDKPGFSAIC